ncbi:MAG: hypothetical protein IJK50_12600, partial [Prevotella sp.]|nr:hypothetical protein [Prevotella sp.]
ETQLSSSGNLEKKSLSSIFTGFAAKVQVLLCIRKVLTFFSPFITTQNFIFTRGKFNNYLVQNISEILYVFGGN